MEIPVVAPVEAGAGAGVRVRPARPEDGEALARLDAGAWPAGTGFPSVGPREPFFDAAHQPGDHLVAERGGEVVGYAFLRTPTPLPENTHVLAVQGLAVAPAARRQGVASALLTAAERTARERGARRLTLRVLGSNPGARAVYARHGFVVEGVLRGEFVLGGEEVDDVLMALPLGPPRPAGRVVGPPGTVHHLELWVADLVAAEPAWTWLLGRLGWREHRRWPGGVSHVLAGTYLVIESGPDVAAGGHDRLRPGLNHLAFHAGDAAAVERLAAEAPAHGWRLLFADRHPHAGGPGHRAAYLEDAGGFEVELVATPG